MQRTGRLKHLRQSIPSMEKFIKQNDRRINAPFTLNGFKQESQNGASV